DVGEVGRRLDVAGLPVAEPLERDPAEILDWDLARPLRRVVRLSTRSGLAGAGGGRHVDAAAPAPLGEPPHALWVEGHPGLRGVRFTGPRELLDEPRSPAAIGLSLLRRVGDEAGKRA